MPDAATPIRSQLAEELERLRAHSLSRTLSIPAGIDLNSNDYLGLAADPRLRHAVAEAAHTSARLASTGSRLLSGNAQVWEDLEARFSSFLGMESALFFTSGYSANLGVMQTLLRRQDVVFSDALNHASIIDGIRLAACRKVVYPHCDLQALEDALKNFPNGSGRKIIVTETVFSMDGDRAPLPQIFDLAERFGAEVVLDEAHALGVFGPEGRGLAAALGLAGRALAIVAPCGKALVSMGAFIAGPRFVRDLMLNHARSFIFSTALPPYFAAQIDTALDLVRQADDRRLRVLTLADTLRHRLASHGAACGATTTQIIPVILGDNDTALFVADRLREEGFTVRAVRPPTVPEGTARLRISMNAGITDDVLDRLAASVIQAGAPLKKEHLIDA